MASVMTAHVIVRELDDAVPATLSPRIVHGLLREEMKFEGVVFSDDLEMKAVSARWGYADAAVRAMNAGCDALPVCSCHEAQVLAMEGLVHAVESGEVPWTRLDDARLRVRRLKEPLRAALPGARSASRRGRRPARPDGGRWREAIAARGGGAPA